MILPGSRLRSAYYDRTRDDRRLREDERTRCRLPQPPPPVPQIQHPPTSADSQQQGDDGEDGLGEV